jgi:hypothetical protein
MREPTEGESIFGFIEEVLSSCNFNWYVKLGYIPERHHSVSESTKLWESVWEVTDPDGHGGWTRTPRCAQDCLEQWLNELQAAGYQDRFWLEEFRRDGQVIFHVLVADWNGFSDAWKLRWKEISHGWAKTRELDERTSGLLSYLVMKAGCMLELNCGRTWGRYSAQDFKQWNERRY